MSDPVVLSNVEGGVATISLNRPDALNAFNADLLESLDKALEDVATDETVRCVILTGNGRAFSAGVDLKVLEQVEIVDGSIGEPFNGLARNIIRTIETMPKPVIARVNGFCFTGALELVLACDLVIVAEEAKLGDTHAKVGIRPTWGMTQRLPRAIGIRKAREMAFTARTISGAEAADLGLANECVPLSGLDAKVGELTAAIVENSADAIAAYKDLFATAQSEGLQDGIAYEERAVYELRDSKERIASILKK